MMPNENNPKDIQKAALQEKLNVLRGILKSMGSVVVAFSAGVDSSFLLKIAAEVLGENCLAVTATSETYTKDELEEAQQLIADIQVDHLIIESHEFENENFITNPPDRCYYCKSELFSKLKKLAKDKGYAFVLDGANVDDLDDYRPGRRATKELEVRSPLQEAGLTKEEIRELSREMGLQTWNKPSMACLSSRIPYGQKISVEKIQQVSQAERKLKEFGFKNLRVRHHGEIARIEIPKQDFYDFISASNLETIVKELKQLGFAYVTLDLQGFRSGSMNEVLKAVQRV